MKVKIAIDIESFGTPEKSGYDIVIPNYAIVPIPKKPTVDIHSFIYVKLPIQEQIKKGLKMDSGSMDFWFNYCRANHVSALNEVTSTFQLEKPEVHYVYPTERYTSDDVLELWRTLRYNRFGEEVEQEVWGNGCNFDCSITQANHLKLFGEGELWKYSAPQNARSLKGLLSENQRIEMDKIVSKQLDKFIAFAAGNGYTGLELHHPLYDAAREAIQISYCLDKKG